MKLVIITSLEKNDELAKDHKNGKSRNDAASSSLYRSHQQCIVTINEGSIEWSSSVLDLFFLFELQKYNRHSM